MILAAVATAVLATAWTGWLTRSLRLCLAAGLAGLVFGPLTSYDALILVPTFAGAITWSITDLRSGEIDDIVTLPLILFLAIVGAARVPQSAIVDSLSEAMGVIGNSATPLLLRLISALGLVLTRSGALLPLCFLWIAALGWAIPRTRVFVDEHIGGWGDPKAVLVMAFAAQSFVNFCDMLLVALALLLAVVSVQIARGTAVRSVRLGPYLAAGIIFAQTWSPLGTYAGSPFPHGTPWPGSL